MIKFYLSTVIIWMIIMWSTIFLCKNELKKKLAKIETEKTSLFQGLTALFAISAIPIIRLIILIMILYIAGCKQEDFDKLMKKANT